MGNTEGVLTRSEKGWLQSVLGPKKMLPEGATEQATIKFLAGAQGDKTVTGNVNRHILANVPEKGLPKEKQEKARLALVIVKGRPG